MIVGADKTATDAVVWLLGNGVASDRIVWVRPREPWMLNRAVVHPDPAVQPTMAKTPTLGAWELDLLRGVHDVVRRGRIRHVTRTEITTASATGCARPTPFPTTRGHGRRCRCGGRSRRGGTPPSRTSPGGANTCALNPARVQPRQRDLPAVQVAATRFAATTEAGLARLATLVDELLPL